MNNQYICIITRINKIFGIIDFTMINIRGNV